jgi:uncharacterized membrane protein YhfC
MSILHVTYALDGLLTIAIPILVAVYIIRKYDLYWRLFWIGAAVFALAQILLTVFNQYIVYPFLSRISETAASVNGLIIAALILGLSTALFEELLRLGMFRWWAREARSWIDGFLTGVGHGGASAIFLGALILYNYINMAMVKNSDLSTLVPAEQLQQAQAQVAAFWSAPWYTTLNDIFQTVFTLAVQIALALVVMQVFVRRQWFWLIIAILAHTFFEMSRIVAQNLLTPLLTDMVIAGFGLAAIAVIIALRPSRPAREITSETAKA